MPIFAIFGADMETKGRFAPSPSGRMHLGNMFSALLSWLSAKSKGGTWLLRIEDLDRQRSHAEYARQIEDDLLWLGLKWDEGGSTGGPNGPYFQSLRDNIYAEAFDTLTRRGLIYPCYCSRADLHAASAPHASDGTTVYAGTCRNLSPEQRAEKEKTRQPAWRLEVKGDISFNDLHYGAQNCKLPAECGDVVLRRADGNFAYNLAVAVDDALMGVTEVVRGNDLLGATPVQIYISQLLGYSAPAYCHLPLLVAEDGRRLSKRDKSADMGWVRQHFAPQQVVGMLAHAAGLVASPEAVEPADLVQDFSWDKVPHENIVFQTP